MPTRTSELWPVPVQLVATIAYELAQHGIPTQQLLEGTGVDEQDILSPEMLLPYRTAQKILTRAHQISPIPQLGLAVGARQSPSSMGVLGYGINCCANVEDALNMVVKYFRVSSTLVISEWRHESGKLYWHAKPPVDLGEILPCIVEEEFAMLRRVHPMLTGQALEILEAHFQFPEPEYVSLYRDTFDCPLFFSAEKNQLVMNSDVLKLPILQANPLSVAAADRMCAEFLEVHPATNDLVMRIRQMILEQNYEFWGEDAIAEKLNLTARTLRNQLRRLDTSYQVILDSLREQIAREDLSRSTLTVNAIAEHIGYSDARSFRRAFKKWTGMTPGDFRYRGTS